MSTERPLEGKVAVITGASRGIGREIALKLAEAGVNIVGNSVDPKKQKRVDETMDLIEAKGVKVSWSFGDISTDQGRKDLWFKTAAEYDKTDYLFLNAAGGLETDLPDDEKEGWAEKINVTSQLDLVNTFRNENQFFGFPPFELKLKNIIYLTSLWAEQFGKVDQPPFYRPVAKTKFLAERRLRELIPDLEQEGVRLGFLSGHITTDTAAHALMSRGFPAYMARIEKTASGEKFPNALDWGETALKMVLSDFKSGHTEYIGGRTVEPIRTSQLEPFTWGKEDIRRKLPMYGDSKLLVNKFFSPKEDEFGNAKETGIGKYIVRDSDTDGHFGGDFQDIKLFRGIDQIESAAQTLGLVFLGLEPDLGFVQVIKGVGGIKFKQMVFPGDEISLHAKLTYMNPQEILGNCEVKIGDQVVSEIKGISLGLIPSIDFARRLIAKQKSGRLPKT